MVKRILDLKRNYCSFWRLTVLNVNSTSIGLVINAFFAQLNKGTSITHIQNTFT